MPRSCLLPLAALCAGLACERSEPAAAPGEPPPAPAKTPASAAESPRAEPPAEACTDWSTFDLSTLPSLPDGAHVATLDAVWRRVLERHYDPTLGCVDWAAIRLAYARRLEGVERQAEAYGIINDMLSTLEQSHYRLFVPGGTEDEHTGPASPALDVRWIEERFVVVRSEEDDVPPGSELVAIDDRPLREAAEKARTRHRVDGRLETVLGRLADAWLSCSHAGATHRLSVQSGSGEAVEAEVACRAAEGERISLGNLSNVPTTVESRMIDGTKVGYVAFNIWMLPMVAKIEDAFTALRRRGMTALVLDLRGNPGGVGPMSVPVARLFLRQSGSLGTLQFRDFAQEFNVEASPDAFEGPVALLVDEATASTSEIFAAGLRDLGRVRIFGGGATAGAALPSVIEELEGGAILQYVVGEYFSPKGTVVEGAGIMPDVVVSETRSAFAAGRDPVLAAAVEHLSTGA